MSISIQRVKKIPNCPGVYFFKKGAEILYIGKATSLADRVRSYFTSDLIATRGPLIADLLFKADRLAFTKTESVLEALILESNLIKKHQPKYNTKEKDNKSFNYVVITKDVFPRVLIMRGKDLFSGKRFDLESPKRSNLKELDRTAFGPYPNGQQLKLALGIIRKIFPFADRCVPGQARPCFNYQLGLCPGICTGAISPKEYKKNIRNIQLFLAGKKARILKNLTGQMKSLARSGEYEKAGEIKNKIFALRHIQDVALIKEEYNLSPALPLTNGRGKTGLLPSLDKEGLREVDSFRLEAYDVAHIFGTSNVGVMVVMEDGEFKKSDYRKFKIRNSRGNDIGALQEIFDRRLAQTEWPAPNLIVVDGGLAQLNVVKNTTAPSPSLTKEGKRGTTHVVAVTKDDRHQPKAIIGDEAIIKKYKTEILRLNHEAHRFVLKYHQSKRDSLPIDF